MELEHSDNISSLSITKAYRVNEVDISTKINKSKNRRFFPFTLALFYEFCVFIKILY